MRTDKAWYSDLALREIIPRLTISPSIVWTNHHLYGVAEAGVRNPGARVIAVVEGQGRLVGVLPLTVVIEHLQFKFVPPSVLGASLDLVETRKFRQHLDAQEAQHLMHPPQSIRLDATVGQALQLLRRTGLAGLPITDSQDQVVGYADQLELLAARIRAEPSAADPDS